MLIVAQTVNDALNSLLIDEGDYTGLRHSIDHFHNFDHIQLARADPREARAH